MSKEWPTHHMTFRFYINQWGSYPILSVLISSSIQIMFSSGHKISASPQSPYSIQSCKQKLDNPLPNTQNKTKIYFHIYWQPKVDNVWKLHMYFHANAGKKWCCYFNENSSDGYDYQTWNDYNPIIKEDNFTNGKRYDNSPIIKI